MSVERECPCSVCVQATFHVWTPTGRICFQCGTFTPGAGAGIAGTIPAPGTNHTFVQRTQRTERPFSPIAVAAIWYDVVQFGQTICMAIHRRRLRSDGSSGPLTDRKP